MSLVVGGVVVVLAVVVLWRKARLPRDQSVSESWLSSNGRDQGKGGSR